MPFPEQCWVLAYLFRSPISTTALTLSCAIALGFQPACCFPARIAALIFAYAIRFLAISFGSLESGLEKVTPNLSFAARTLGRTPLADGD